MEKKTKYALIGLGTIMTLGAGALIYLQYQKKQTLSPKKV
jgi:hypothetical protein